MNKSKLLKLVLAQFETRTNWSDYICVMLSHEARAIEGARGVRAQSVAISIRDDIADDMRIGKWEANRSEGAFNTWLADNHPDVHCKMTSENFREARIQWMNAMIAHYESKGQ